MMKKEIYQAAVRGNIEFLEEAQTKDVEAVASFYNNDDLLGLTSHGNNIIHVAAKHGQLNFIKKALELIFPKKLICGTNLDGDTPLHLAAKQQTQTIVEHLITSYNVDRDDNEITSLSLSSSSSSPLLLPPWRVQNKKGNTPLHVALMNGGKSIQVAAYLVGVDPEVASFVNQLKQTPLHLAVKYNNQGAKLSMTQMVNTLNSSGALMDYTKSYFEEDTISVIKLLLESSTTVCCLPDEHGMTPLLEAAVNSFLPAVKAIIDYCPESVEICDFMGKNILHHIKLPTFLEARKFLQTPEICALMDQQDEDGNTPVHIAIMNCNYSMVKAMFECNANFVIKNNEGSMAATMIHSESSSFLDKVKGSMKGSIINYIDKMMSKELYEEAGHGGWQSLTKRLEEAAESDQRQFLYRLPDGNNIVHVAMEECQIDIRAEILDIPANEYRISSQEIFVVKALEKFPILSCQTNLYGETPLHIAMSRKIFKPDTMPFRFLQHHLKQIKSFPLPPWKAKDAEGSTLLHRTLSYSRYKLAECLIELDANLVREVNNSKETCLHILCRRGSQRASIQKELCYMVDLILQKDVTLVYLCDAEGLTPFLRAVLHRRLKVAARILHHCPQSIKQYDSQLGRSIFHLISFERNDDMIEEFCKVPQMKHLMTINDDKGNSALHTSIKQRRFGTVKFLMEKQDDKMNYRLINEEGKTVGDVLAKTQNVPRWFQEFLLSKSLELPEVAWSGKTLYGIQHSDMKEYMGTLGVVSALLATMTFTAAFTVPGGYNDETGTPILAKKVAFQIFMFTDVVGMCSSIMVLFCLLWFLNTGQLEEEGSALVDSSIGLLQLSFYSTLIAFMTGVYVTIMPDIQWLAIFTCILCSAVLLLMRKRFILYFAYVFRVLFILLELGAFLLGACGKLIAHSLKSRCWSQANRP